MTRTAPKVQAEEGFGEDNPHEENILDLRRKRECKALTHVIKTRLAEIFQNNNEGWVFLSLHGEQFFLEVWLRIMSRSAA